MSWSKPVFEHEGFWWNVANALLLSPPYYKPAPSPLTDLPAPEEISPGHPGVQYGHTVGGNPIMVKPGHAPEDGEYNHFYIIDRRVDGSEEVMVGVGRTRSLALEGYRGLIDQAFTEPTYMVRLYRIPMPADMDPRNPDKAVEVAMQEAQNQYRGCEQVAAFARLMNEVIVDMSVIDHPHLQSK